MEEQELRGDSFLGRLPIECLDRICSFLSLKDLGRIAQINTLFHSIAVNNKRWRQQTYQKLYRTDNSFVTSPPQPAATERAARRKNITKYEFLEEVHKYYNHFIQSPHLAERFGFNLAFIILCSTMSVLVLAFAGGALGTEWYTWEHQYNTTTKTGHSKIVGNSRVFTWRRITAIQCSSDYLISCLYASADYDDYDMQYFDWSELSHLHVVYQRSLGLLSGGVSFVLARLLLMIILARQHRHRWLHPPIVRLLSFLLSLLSISLMLAALTLFIEHPNAYLEDLNDMGGASKIHSNYTEIGYDANGKLSLLLPFMYEQFTGADYDNEGNDEDYSREKPYVKIYTWWGPGTGWILAILAIGFDLPIFMLSTVSGVWLLREIREKWRSVKATKRELIGLSRLYGLK